MKIPYYPPPPPFLLFWKNPSDGDIQIIDYLHFFFFFYPFLSRGGLQLNEADVFPALPQIATSCM